MLFDRLQVLKIFFRPLQICVFSLFNRCNNFSIYKKDYNNKQAMYFKDFILIFRWKNCLELTSIISEVTVYLYNIPFL